MRNRKQCADALDACHTPSAILTLLCELVEDDQGHQPISTFTSAVYDTAWLAMVYRTSEGGSTEWLFPTCWESILNAQLDDGTWPAYASSVDGILNSLAALLALLRHRQLDGDGECDGKPSLSSRIQRAQDGLHRILQTWQVEKTLHVGFEVLVPRLLLQIADFGISFSFPDAPQLDHLYSKKIKKLNPDAVYSPQQTTLLHSLEALVGLVDFANLRHHCSERTGILGSPAATAAYLMHADPWDKNAERYLKATVDWYEGDVPSAFPTEIFEICWVISTLISRAISVQHLGTRQKTILQQFLDSLIYAQDGTVGFTLGLLPDADDSSRLLMARASLGLHVDVQPLIKRFATGSHFRTYQIEGSASPSANCNVLLLMLELEQVTEHVQLIEGILDFIVKRWRAGLLEDKWNLDKNYLLMLFADVVVRILRRLDDGTIQFDSPCWTKENFAILIFQVLSRILTSQSPNGSWGGSMEGTSYAVIAITQCLALPWSQSVCETITMAASKGREFIAVKTKGNTCLESRLWVEKVSYGSALLQRTYAICALHSSCTILPWNHDTINLYMGPGGGETRQLITLLSRTPLFKANPLVSLDLVLGEAPHHARELHEECNNIFPRDQMPFTHAKYLEFIPVFWIFCNHISGLALTPEIVRAMLMVSMLNYQADEYMETVVAQLSLADIGVIKNLLAKKCGVARGNNHAFVPVTPAVHEVYAVLDRFITHILSHPKVLETPANIQQELAIELYNFFSAHISHNLDNHRLRQLHDGRPENQVTDTTSSSTPTYFHWVRTTGADDTSCPFSFIFFLCLISHDGSATLSASPQARYLSRALCRHLATMCRQYNDYGSASRDLDECNLSSFDFREFGGKEFRSETNDHRTGSSFFDQAKANLMDIAQFERSCVEHVLCRLQSLPDVEPDVLSMLQVFINVTDLWGQIYVIKDIASRVTSSNGHSR